MGDNGKKPSFFIDGQSLYFLHPLDSPEAIITTIKFDGRNYELWEQAVPTALMAKNKLGFIDDSIAEPEDKSTVEGIAWIVVNSMVTSWIMNVIDPKLHTSFAYAKSVGALWENIHKRYSIPNVPKIHQLKAQIASCKQNKQEVVEFFNRLVGLWNELGNYVKIPDCKCGAAAKIARFMEDDKAHQFFVGLDDDSFSTIQSQILALDSLPPLDKIFNVVQEEENHRRVMIGRDNNQDTVAVFAVSHQAKSQNS